IVPMIVITPVLAGTAAASPEALLLRFGGAIAAIGAVAVMARFVMPRLLHQVAQMRIRELSVLVGLLVCLAMSWFTGHLGFSLALGAFLAGILVSETEYSHQMIADIVPFRDVFASLFFMSVGMLVDLDAALTRLPLLLGLAGCIVVLKSVLAAGAIKMAGYPARVAVVGGLSLAQIGEFSFVLMEVGRANGLLGGDGFQILLAASVLTLLVTPLLVAWAPAVGEWVVKSLGMDPEEGEADSSDLHDHVIVVGFGTNGTLLARVLEAARLRFVAVELNAEIVRVAQGNGVPMLYGDATRQEILEHAGIDRARVMVVAISDPRAVERMVRLAKSLHPELEIIVRTRQLSEIEELRRLGADEVVAEEFEAAIEIFTLVLERFHIPRNLIRAQTRLLRGEGYRMLRAPSVSAGTSEAVLEALEAGTTDLYRLAGDSPAVGKTLRELDLRRSSGASVIAVVRGESSRVSPSADLALESGDCLVLVGGHAEIDAAFVLLDRGGGDLSQAS
ncbi:MAG: cation:proton antiporter, partial [Holophagales bacterium]|nr:cation:proton antiporter [Holophagales bacterium]